MPAAGQTLLSENYVLGVVYKYTITSENIMGQSIKDVLNNVKDIYMSDSALATLLDFERVLDEAECYVFKNWKQGELVSGPIYEKYFVTCTFMWPYKKMPDPRGGQQLLNYNCEVLYKREYLEFPKKITSPDDFIPNTKMGKLQKTPIWLVTVTIPKKLMAEIHRGSIEVENENIDLDDLSQAYEEGTDVEDSGISAGEEGLEPEVQQPQQQMGEF